MPYGIFSKKITKFITAHLLCAVLLSFANFGVLASAFLPSLASVAEAATEINYQGKLMTSSNVAVPDGLYNIEFKLYTVSSGGSAIWTETRTGADRVQVTNGLFSVLLGSVSSLAGINFDQEIYLGVNIGGSGSPSWDGEMTPRKKFASVPTAFVSDTAKALDATNATSTNLRTTNATTTNIAATNANISGSLSISSLTGLLVGTNGSVSAISTSTLGLITTDIAEGTNLYFTNARADARIGLASTTIRNMLSSSATGLTYTAGTGDLALAAGYTIPLTASTTEWASKVGSQWVTSGSDIYYNSGNVGVGTTTPSAKVHSLSTTEQLRLGYNASNYASFTVSSVGKLVIGATGGQVLAPNGSVNAGFPTPGVGFASFANTGIGADSGNLALWQGGIIGINIASSAKEIRVPSDFKYSFSSATHNNAFADTSFYRSAAGVLRTGGSFITDGNIGIGTNSPGYKLDVSGGFINVDGSTGYRQGGFLVLNASSSSASTQVGLGAGASFNSGSYYNTAVGYYAMTNTTSSRNTAVGSGALRFNVSGISNVAFGNDAAGSSRASYNVAIGDSALYSATSSGSNTAVGHSALLYAIGSGNTALGYLAGQNITSGSNNIIIGNNIYAQSATASNQLSIGNIIFGTGVDGSGTSVSSGNIGIGTTTPGYRLVVSGDLNLTGAFRANGSAGTAGMVLQTTGTGTQWVATSTLGISGGSSLSGGANGYLARWTSATTLATSSVLDSGTRAGINATSSSYTFNIQGTAGISAFNVASSTGTSLLMVGADGNIGIGTTTAASKLVVVGDAYVTGSLRVSNGTLPVVIGATDGNTRATNALDLQSYRTSSSQVASGVRSTAIGNRNTASGVDSIAIGQLNTPSALVSIALGNSNSAFGDYAVAIGASNSAASNSQVIGKLNTALYLNSSVVGISNTLYAGYSQAFGNSNSLFGLTGSVGIGTSNTAYGGNATIIGQDNTSSDDYNVTLGYNNYAFSGTSVTIGHNNSVDNGVGGGSDVITVGSYNTVSGTSFYTSAFGSYNTISGSTYYNGAFGYQNSVSGNSSYAIGRSNAVSGENSYVFGNGITNGIGGSVMIGTSNTNKMTLTTNGSLGIGTTTPASKLTVVGNAGASPMFTVASSTGRTAFVVRADGNVGIGTSTPNTNLYIDASSGTGNIGGYQMVIEGSPTNTALLGFKVANNEWSIGASSLDEDKFMITSSLGYTQDVLVIDRSTGNVGIGSSTPSAKLSIFNLSGNQDLINVSSSTGVSMFAVKASGNVGIGTTTPFARLQVAGVTTSSGIPLLVTDSAGASVIAARDSGAVSIGALSAGLSGSQPSKTGSLNVYGTSATINIGHDSFDYGYKMVIGPRSITTTETSEDSNATLFLNSASGGRVSIGTTTDASPYTLRVGGDINFGGNLYQDGVLFTGGGGASPWTVSGSKLYATSTSVGVGTTNPLAAFDIGTSTNGVGTMQPMLRFSYTPDVTYSSAIKTSTGGSIGQNQMGFFITRNGTELNPLLLSDSGITLTGTTTMAGILNLNNATADTGKALTLRSVTNDARDGGIKIVAQNQSQWMTLGWGGLGSTYTLDFSSGSGSDITFLSGNNTVFSTGNVGVGTTTPGYKLSVAGDINFTGNLYQNGVLFTGSATSSSESVAGNYAFSEDSTVAQNLTRYLATPGGAIATVIDTVSVVITRSGTLKNMYVNAKANTFSGTATYTIMLNGSDTALSASTTGSGVLNASNVSSSVAVSAGDVVQVKMVTGAGTGSVAQPRVSFELVENRSTYFVQNNVSSYAGWTNIAGVTRLSTTTTPVLVGGTSTTTASAFEVLGNAYISNSLSIATTSSTYALNLGGGMSLSGAINFTNLSNPNLMTYNGTIPLISDDGVVSGGFYAGYNAGGVARSGASGNVGIGGSVLDALTSGDFNTGIGATSLTDVTSAAGNTALGYGALVNVNTGSNNIGIGRSVAANLTTGSNNIYIGYNIDALSATATNTLSIGNLIYGNGVDGSGSTVSTGNIGIGTSTTPQRLSVAGSIFSSGLLGGATNLTVDANGVIIRDPSDLSLKENVATIENALDKVMQLRGVSYEWIDKARFGSSTEVGVIAQEVEQVVPEVVSSGGEYKSIKIANLVGVLIEAVKELNVKVSAIAKEVRNGIVYFAKISVEGLTVGSKEKPAGITIYDEATGDPFCIKVVNGVMANVPGECGSEQPPTVVESQTPQDPPVEVEAEDGQVSEEEDPQDTSVGQEEAETEDGTEEVPSDDEGAVSDQGPTGEQIAAPASSPEDSGSDTSSAPVPAE